MQRAQGGSICCGEVPADLVLGVSGGDEPPREHEAAGMSIFKYHTPEVWGDAFK